MAKTGRKVAHKRAKTVTRVTAVRIVEDDYRQALDQLIDSIFQAAAGIGWTWTEFARVAGVSPSTVRNMGYRRTRFPEYRTVFRLSKAVGMEMRLMRLSRRKAAA